MFLNQVVYLSLVIRYPKDNEHWLGLTLILNLSQIVRRFTAHDEQFCLVRRQKFSISLECR